MKNVVEFKIDTTEIEKATSALNKLRAAIMADVEAIEKMSEAMAKLKASAEAAAEEK